MNISSTSSFPGMALTSSSRSRVGKSMRTARRAVPNTRVVDRDRSTATAMDIDQSALIASANELVDRYVAASRFSGVVLVAFGDEVRLERSFGLASGIDTPLTFGSLAKMFTGYLV